MMILPIIIASAAYFLYKEKQVDKLQLQPCKLCNALGVDIDDMLDCERGSCDDNE